MNLNPIIKFDIDCPVTLKRLLERLKSVTSVRHPLKPDFGFFGKDNVHRYAGKVLADRFRIRTLPRISLQTFLFHTHRQIVIHGKVEDRGPRSYVRIVIRPMIGVLAGWLAVTAGLVMILARIIDGFADLVDWIFLAFFAVWVFSSIHIYTSTYIIERAFLEKLLGSPESHPGRESSAQRSSSDSQVISNSLSGSK